MKNYTPNLSYRYIAKIIILFSVYLLTAKVGLSLYAVNKFATFVWPPTGIALAALIIYGYDLWPGITAGAFLINFGIIDIFGTWIHSILSGLSTILEFKRMV